jgi:hypothetical protein
MIRRLLDRFNARGAEQRHPDLTFEEVEAPPQETHASLPAQHVLSSDGNDMHPDFDFDPDIAGPINRNADLQPFLTEISQRTEELDVLMPDKDTQFWDKSYANGELESIPEWAPDPLDFAISMEDVAAIEEDAAPDVDWFFDPVDTRDEVTGQAAEPLDLFDFDISDLEAELESEPVAPETSSARGQRLDGVAADLVLGLGAFPSSERRSLHRRFRAILEEFPHHSSHLALHRLLKTGASLEEIEEAASLRRIWLDQPWLWGQKRRVLRSWEVWRNTGQRLAFGWPTALRLIRVFGIVESERALVEDWFQAWIGLQRQQASDLADEMAFFTYSEFLRQVSQPHYFCMSEGVHEEHVDQEDRLEIRDNHGLQMWRFESKLPDWVGEISLETPRVRNHLKFDSAARDDNFGLGGLTAISEVEVVATGYQRAYLFPDQDFSLTRNDKVKLSTETGHGNAKIKEIDAKQFQIVIVVPHNYKRLLSNCAAVIRNQSALKPNPAELEPRRAIKETKAKDAKT